MNAELHLTTFKDWLSAKGHPASTIGTYVTGANALFDYFNESDHPKNISTRQLIAFLASIPSPHTRKSVRCSVKLFYTVVVKQPNKFDSIPPVMVPGSVPTILSPTEVNDLISKTTNLKHRTILKLIYTGALRISEPINIRPEHISQSFDPIMNGPVCQLHIVGAKGNKDRMVALPMETFGLIENYKQQYKPAQYLFEGQSNPQYSTASIRNIFYQACIRAGIIKDVTPHSLRHSRATHLLEGGMQLPYLQAFLGHKRITTTMIYLHCTSSALARAMQNADGYVQAVATNSPVDEVPLPMYEYED